MSTEARPIGFIVMASGKKTSERPAFGPELLGHTKLEDGGFALMRRTWATVFESENAAIQALDRVPPSLRKGVTFSVCAVAMPQVDLMRFE